VNITEFDNRYLKMLTKSRDGKRADFSAAANYTDARMALLSLSPAALIAVYCGLTLLASLAGGWIPLLFRLTHTRLQVATSFVAGMMLGVAVLHMLPHAWEESHSIDQTARWMLGGFLVMFFIQRFFHFHHHDVPEGAPEPGSEGENESESEAIEAEHAGHAGHAHAGEGHTLAHQSARQLSWGGAALGLSLHSLIDGVALAASVAAESQGHPAGTLFGLGTFLVVILHKPFDAMAVGTLMAAGGSSRSARHWVNGLFALAIPVGVLLFRLGAMEFSKGSIGFLGVALSFTAGTFLCIAASDLLPELQFHSHDRVKLSVALLAGLVFAALIGMLESEGHGHGAQGLL
jgi:zinc and cadmium transporter